MTLFHHYREMRATLREKYVFFLGEMFELAAFHCLQEALAVQAGLDMIIYLLRRTEREGMIQRAYSSHRGRIEGENLSCRAGKNNVLQS